MYSIPQSFQSSPLISGLSFRLIIAVLMFAVGTTAAYYFLAHRPLFQKLAQYDENEVRWVYRNLRRQLESDFTAACLELTRLARTARVRSMQKERLDDALRFAEELSTFYTKFTVLNEHGRIASRPSLEDSVGDDRKDRDYYRGTMATKELYVADVTSYGSGLSISIGVPVYDRDGQDKRLRGVLAGHVRLTGASPRLCKTAEGWSTQSRYEAILLSRNGYKIAHSTGPIEAQTVAEVDCRQHPLYALAGEDATSHVYQLDGVSRYGIVHKLAPADWILILQVEKEPIIASVESAVNGIALLLGVVFAALLGIVVFYGARIVRPINHLTSSLVHFGKTGCVVSLHRGPVSGEVGDAVEAFNQMVVERSQAESELLRQRGELRAFANELSRVEQRTRHVIAGELHDHISQDLAASKIRLELLRNKQSSVDREDSLRIAIDLLGRCILSASNLTKRLVHPSLRQLGLAKALEALVATYRAEYDMEFEFRNECGEISVEDEIADTVYRGVRELLHNIVKHADARRTSLRLRSGSAAMPPGEELVIEVEDDGVGFDAAEGLPAVGQVGGFGLLSFRERIREFGGRIEIVSSPNRGCLVTVSIPHTAQPRLTVHDQDFAGRRP